MRVRCPSPCFLNHSKTSLSTRRCTDVLPGGTTTRARFQNLESSFGPSGASARVSSLPCAICCLISVSVYLTVVGFLVMLIGLPCAHDVNRSVVRSGVNNSAHGGLNVPERDVPKLAVILTIIDHFDDFILEDQGSPVAPLG